MMIEFFNRVGRCSRKTSSVVWLFSLIFVLLVGRDVRLVAAKSLLSEATAAVVDDLANDVAAAANDYDRQNAQNLDEPNEGDAKINRLLEKYLVSSSSSASSSSSSSALLKRRKQKQHTNLRSAAIGDNDFYDDEWSMSDDLSDRAASSPAEVNSRSSSNSNNNQNIVAASSLNNNNPRHHTLVKKYFRIPTAGNKRAWDIQTYYDVFIQNDGSVLFIPKDVNKNHYFIG